MSRNADKGREAENAVARVLREAGFTEAERRSKRGGYTHVECDHCDISGEAHGRPCTYCAGAGVVTVHRDAGDIAGVPRTAVQVKWSPYMPLHRMLAATETQRIAAGAWYGLLVVKRKGVGLARAGEWDAYLPERQLAPLLGGGIAVTDTPWRADLAAVARVLAESLLRVRAG